MVFSVGAVGLFAEERDPLGILLSIAITAGTTRATLPWIDLYEDRVVIGGPLRRRRVIPRSEILSCQPDKYGLDFWLASGGVVTGPGAIGAKGLLLSAFGVVTQGDRIAHAISGEEGGQRAKRSE